MGGLFSNNRNNEGIEPLEHSDNNAYRYPPKCGNYFGSHFFMGGERFESTQPEAFLYGDNMDLNFLGNRPFPFPYPVTVGSEPSKALRGYVNIRKDSLRLFKLGEEEADEEEEMRVVDSEEATVTVKPKFGIEFVLDSDLPCTITVHLFAKEELIGGELRLVSKVGLSSPPVHLPAGYKQQFRSSCDFEISPWDLPEEQWSYRPDCDHVPLVIHCDIEKEHLLTLENRGEHILGPHGQVTLMSVEHNPDSSACSLRLLKQKQIIDGLPYLLQEVYGLFQYNESGDLTEETDDDANTDCVVCMSEIRDTLILPCRHLCLCAGCAESLRYQASACPICRAPFRALLQVRGLRRVIPLSVGHCPLVGPFSNLALRRAASEEEEEVAPEDEVEEEEPPSLTPSSPSNETPTALFSASNPSSPTPPKPAPHGYEAVSLLELLSSGWLSSAGPHRSHNAFTASPDGGSAYLLRSSSSRRFTDHEACSISLESGSLRTRGSKRKMLKKRARQAISPSSDIAAKAAALLTARGVELTLEGADGEDCEVIELTPTSRRYHPEPRARGTEAPSPGVLDDLQQPRQHPPPQHGFRSVELLAPGNKSSRTEFALLDAPPVPVLAAACEEDSSLSSAASGRALLSPEKPKEFC